MNDNTQKNNQNVLASPKARKFARELGVDVNDVVGTERLGRVIEKDIKEFVSSKINKNFSKKNEKEIIKIKNEYEHAEFGEVEIKEISRIKKIAVPHLVNSWTSIPHVTNHDEADITEMEEFRNSLTDIYTGEKKKINPLAFIIKAVVSSLKKFQSFNSSIDDIEIVKIILKKYFGKIPVPGLFTSIIFSVISVPLGIARLDTILRLANSTALDSAEKLSRTLEPRDISINFIFCINSLKSSELSDNL